MLRISFLLALLVVPGLAWMTGSSVSSFGGSVLITERPSTMMEPRPQQQVRSVWTMKKGKANVPPQMRSQYAKQQEMMAMREQMIAATKPGSDGFPVFNLFVRTKRANVRSWWPALVVFLWVLEHHHSSFTTLSHFRFAIDAFSFSQPKKKPNIDVVPLW